MSASWRQKSSTNQVILKKFLAQAMDDQGKSIIGLASNFMIAFVISIHINTHSESSRRVSKTEAESRMAWPRT